MDVHRASQSILRRRPATGTVLGAIALFVALGGPAQAGRLLDGARIRPASVPGRAIKPNTLTGAMIRAASVGGDRLADRSVALSKLTPGAVGVLTATPDNDVTGAKVLDRSLSGADLGDETLGQTQIARDGVGPTELADNAVTSGKVADGRLTVADVASFAGTATFDPPSLAPQSCKHADQAATLLWPHPGATIADDAVLVSPPDGFDDRLILSARPSGTDGIRFVVCNAGTSTIDAGPVTVRYLTFGF